MKILRVSNASGHTSAPLNSFTLARSQFYQDEKTTFISFFNNDLDAVDLFKKKYEIDVDDFNKRVTLEEAGGKISTFWSYLRKWIKKNRNTESIIHLHQSRSGFLASIAAKMYGSNIPIVYTIHNNFSNYGFQHKIALIFNFLIVDRIVFVSKDAFSSFPALLTKIVAKKIVTIQNGVDIERIQKSIKTSINKKSNNNLNLISTGRLTEQKYQQFLIDAVANLQGNWTLNIYGEGRLEKQLKEKIKNNSLENRVNLKDTVPRDEILKAYAEADIFLSTALWEGLPVALMEAMAAGLPCVVSDIPSHQELGDDIPGLLITKFNVDNWRENLSYLTNLDNDKRIELGQKNKKVIEENFTLRKMQDNYRAIYHKLIHSK